MRISYRVREERNSIEQEPWKNLCIERRITMLILIDRPEERTAIFIPKT